MKRIAIILFLLTVSLTFTFGQTVQDSITIKKVFGGYMFYKGERRLTMNQLVGTMKTNEVAYKQIKSAQSNNLLATIIGGAGGFMVGYTVGTALGGGDPNWAVAGVGAGLIVVSIPISQNFNKKAKQAVDTYNAGLQPIAFRYKKELKFSVTGHGVGLTLRF